VTLHPYACAVEVIRDPYKVRFLFHPPITLDPNAAVPVTRHPHMTCLRFCRFPKAKYPIPFIIPVTPNPQIALFVRGPPIAAHILTRGMFVSFYPDITRCWWSRF
jgi:hypothetical protein